MSIAATLQEAARRHAGRPAVWVGGNTLSYGDLALHGDAVILQSAVEQSGVIMIATERKFPFFCTAFGCLSNGITYVPINPKWPATRILQIAEVVTPDAILFDSITAHTPTATELVRLNRAPVFEVTISSAMKMRQLCDGAERSLRTFQAADYAYIMFTSGSTGVPKGVPITTLNLSSYVAAMSKILSLTSEDRVLQTVETTFDLSVHDMMLSWTAGAMLAIVPEGNAPFGPRFVRQLGITSWLCVPSAGAQAKNHGLLRPDSMPSLRTSLFCGEALPAALARTWLAAAPNSRVLNIYGPTEATIAFSAFEVERGKSQAHAVVPLGYPIGDQKMDLDDNGELLLCGTQLSPGYLSNPGGTEKAFILRNGVRWYRTGDRASFEAESGYLYKGRLDSQVKLRGYRVELGEVEAALRKHCDTDLVAAVPIYEVGPTVYEKLVGVICGGNGSLEEIRVSLRQSLPEYMVPDRFVSVQEMPKNSNDKIDYLALRKLLET